MKKLLTIILVFGCLILSAQEKAFRFQGQVVDQLMQPIPDVYVVNLNTHQKDISNSNGVFSLWVYPHDSLIFSHISYFRSVVKVHYLLLNPVVMMESENVDIPEIRISSKDLSDAERAELNMNFLETYNPPLKQRMSVENNPVNQIVLENNELMRSEASSIHIASFSPGYALNLLYSKLKRKDPLTDYSSTRKVVQPPVENQEGDKKEK